MVNAKYVAFKVNKQPTISQGPAQAYGTIINCRAQAGKHAGQAQKEVRSHHVPLSNVPGALKRKRGDDGKHECAESTAATSCHENSMTPPPALLQRPLLTQHWQQCKPVRRRKCETTSKGVDLDSWFTILSFSDPAQLLEMREKIASCYRFLRDNPMLWKHSRSYYYGSDMPDPPSELTEFQYAHLRHGHGCMSCGAKSTRKTYWAFLRRWCKACLQSKTIRESDALALLKGENGEDISFIKSCLPPGIFDSWGNFVGVGPAATHSLKTIYSVLDVRKLVAEYIAEARTRSADQEELRTWYATWHADKMKIIEERKVFAKQMELWEETTRSTKSIDYQARKFARKVFFQKKALQLTPPIELQQLEACPSYRRAIAIPKAPNITSWNQLRPKLEKEAAEMLTQERRSESAAVVPSSSRDCTPHSSSLDDLSNTSNLNSSNSSNSPSNFNHLRNTNHSGSSSHATHPNNIYNPSNLSNLNNLSNLDQTYTQPLFRLGPSLPPPHTYMF
ncbi:hypothetical protein NX059_008999 [Plenodomus lindquistii]|nr:hypothetical protein NX059_008999 [Plenodomus lindquistii]